MRRARASDREAVLSFATRTFDGWDYIPQVWDEWITADEGVLLVATRPDEDRPIAVTRVVLLSDDEGWLEGIRVDPVLRGRGVATNLQIAELAWAHAHHLRVVRYMTDQGNEGSVRLGAHHGFAVIGDLRSHGRSRDVDRGPGDRPSTLAALDAAGVLVRRDADEPTIEAAWRIVEMDATFQAGGRLYEDRPWAIQRLDRERFEAHVRAGEVLFDAAGPAVAIMPGNAALADDDRPHFATVAGDGIGALRLALAAEAAAGQGIVTRLTDPAPIFDDPAVVEAWAAAGLGARERVYHLLERQLPVGETLPRPEPDDALLFRETPTQVAIAPKIGSAQRIGAGW
ncbi:MAG: GNAT family N-acetyltransferase [Candidatus Limnocylindrales bacterium]